MKLDITAGHYETESLSDIADRENKRNIEVLKHFFSGKIDYELNWLFIGTSGVHGTYTKLSDYPESKQFTVLVVNPRLVRMIYGTVKVEDRQDYEFLKETCSETLASINENHSQNTLEFERVTEEEKE